MARARKTQAGSLDRLHVVLVRARSWVCALPAAEVVETMRPLPIDKVKNAPPFVAGVSVVRGELVPVLSLTQVLGGAAGGRGERFVLMHTGDRRIALLVDEVIGVSEIDEASFSDMPPLLAEALPAEVARMGSLDGQAFAMLDAGRILPEGAFEALTGRSD